MTDLVVISLEAWDEVWRRNQHLLVGLLRAGQVRNVLFVEPPVDVAHDLKSGRKPQPTGLREIAVSGVPGQVWGLRPRKFLPRRLDRSGDRRRARQVVNAARRLGLHRPALWVNDPGGVEVLTASGWPALYDITDDWLVAERPSAELTRLRSQEAALLAQRREVVVCSAGLVRTKSPLRDVVLIPNAVDLEPYRTRQPRPRDLPESPVAVYMGTAHPDRVDVNLVLGAAAALGAAGATRGGVVLVGPAPLPQADLHRLKGSGVMMLGPRASHTVPAYLQHADVLIVPHVLTRFTESLDPIKAYEYRAARRPVVSTPVPGFVDVVDPLVRVVQPAEFPVAVAAAAVKSVPWDPAIPDDIPTWVQRVAMMADVIDRVGVTAP